MPLSNRTNRDSFLVLYGIDSKLCPSPGAAHLESVCRKATRELGTQLFEKHDLIVGFRTPTPLHVWDWRCELYVGASVQGDLRDPLIPRMRSQSSNSKYCCNIASTAHILQAYAHHL